MSLSIEQTGTLHAADGTPLFYRQWQHPHARGAVVLVHGLGEHGGRYAHVAALFLGAGLSVRIHDHRGHGRSGGARGSLTPDGDFLADLKLVFDDFARQTGFVPWLFGHSMGGLIAARFATGAISPVSGLMLSSPALALHLSGFQRLLLAVSTRLLPALAVPSGLPPNRISHDSEVVRAARDDHLNHGRVAARVINFMLAAIAQTQRDAALLRVPLLMQVAGEDVFVDPQGSRVFFEHAAPGDKTFHFYPQAYHEIFNEVPELRSVVQADLTSWLDAHVK